MKLTGFESNIEIQKEIGARIQRQRINSELTQKNLARKAGVSLKTISNIEKGEDVKFSILLRILQALGYIDNIDLLIPEVLIRPSDYLLLDKPRERVRKSLKKNNSFKWGDEL